MFEKQSPSTSGDNASLFNPGTSSKSAFLGGLPSGPSGVAAGPPDDGAKPGNKAATAAASMMAHWGTESDQHRVVSQHSGTAHPSTERGDQKLGQGSANPGGFDTPDAAFAPPGTSWDTIGGAWAQASQARPAPGQVGTMEPAVPGAESRAGKNFGDKESPGGAKHGIPESARGAEGAAAKEAPAPGAAVPEMETGAKSSEAGKDSAPSATVDAHVAAPQQDKRAAVHKDGSPDIMHGGGGVAKHSPNADPGFQAVKTRVGVLATSKSEHAPAPAKASEAEDAATSPPGELESQAEANHLGVIEQAQGKPFSRQAFKAALLERVAQSVPKNLEEADNFKNSNRLGEVKSGLQQHVDKGKQEAQSDIKQKAEQAPSMAGLTPRTPRPLAPSNPGSPSPSLNAAQATPKPRGESEISLQAGPRAVEQQMAEAHVTEPQLQRSNESQFGAAVTAKQQLAHNSQSAPGAYRQTEQGTLTQAHAEAESTAQTQSQGMQSQRGQALGQVTSQQGTAKSKDEQARAQVVAQVQQIFGASKQRVEQRLARIDGEVNQIFDQGAAAAKQEFEGYVDGRMRAYKDERYGGIFGGLRWVKDKLFGMPTEVDAFYQEGKQRYLARMDGVLDRIASTVEIGLAEAKAEVGRGKQEVRKYVGSLPTALKQVGQEAQQQIQSQFDNLEQSIRDKHDQLIDTLAQKYCDNVKQIDERIGELKAQNQGLIDKAIALARDVIRTIKQLSELLFRVLARCAAIIGKILMDPIGFIGNLVAGAKAGFNKFVTNIGKHLQEGLVGWLTGQLGTAGITMPDSFDARGIFSLVTQVLGLTWQNIRARAVQSLGEKAVTVIEKASDIVQLLISGGPAAVWEHVQGMVGDLKSMVLDEIKHFVTTEIIHAGVQWVLGLLNPASAFIKACKAIYDIIMFFVERAAQIAELVNAVLDSVEAVAGGNVSAMADKIDGALSKALPVAISFLASLLGLNGISEKIKKILQKVRQPIEKAIDAVLKKAVELLKQSGKWAVDTAQGKNDGPKNSPNDPPNDAAKDPKHGGANGRSGAPADPKHGAATEPSGAPGTRSPEQLQQDLQAGLAAADQLVAANHLPISEIRTKLPALKGKYSLKVLDLVVDSRHGAKATVHVHGEVNPTGDTEKKEVELEEVPVFRESLFISDETVKNKSWSLSLAAHVEGAPKPPVWGLVGVALTGDNMPQEMPGPSMMLENRVSLNDKQVKLDAQGFSFTRAALEMSNAAYKKRFGKEPTSLDGHLIDSNLKNFQTEFAKIRKSTRGLGSAQIAQQAIRSVSFGRHRMELGYRNFEITLGDEVELDLGSPLGVVEVPRSVDVVAKKDEAL